MKKINLKNYEDYNEFEQDYITDKFNETFTEFDGEKLPLMDVTFIEELGVEGNRDVYYPSKIQSVIEECGDGENGYTQMSSSRVKEMTLLCTKEEMLQAWVKEEKLYEDTYN